MKKIYTVLAIAVTGFAFAQSTAKIGVNTSTPSATLDIQPTATNAATSATTVEGVLVPRVSRLRAANMGTAVPESTLVYINSIADGSLAGTTVNVNETGFYYFKGGVWTKVGGAVSSAKNVVTITSAYTITGSEDVIISDIATASTLITFPATGVEGKEICLFQRGGGDIYFSTNVRGQAGSFIQNTGGCWVFDGTSLWLQTTGY